MNKETDTLKGLTSQEVQEKLEHYGYNQLNEKEESWYKRLFKRFWGPIPWMIEIAALLSYFAHKYEDFIIIMILLFVNAFVDFFQESKALSAISVLKQKLQHHALVFRDDHWQTVEAKELVPDDLIKVKIGDIAPADLKLLDNEEFLLVDQSALTGESLPVTKKGGEEIYANAVIKQGEMLARVTNTGSNTYFGKTVGLVAKAQHEQKSHFQKMVLNVGNFLIALTIVMILVILGVGYFRDESMSELLIFSLVLTISAIPVAMPAVLTVTMAVGARVLAKKKAIVSRLSAIEELAGMDILCSDKTGTLTKNEMSLSQPFTLHGFTANELYYYAALASIKENEDPIEKPIFAYIDDHHLNDKLYNAEFIKHIPFDPVRKRIEATYKIDDNTINIIKGAPQVILSLSDISGHARDAVEEQIHQYALKGFRTLGVAFKNNEDEKYTFVGMVPLYDPPRDDSLDAIAQALDQGITVKIVTGDNIAVAQYISSILRIGEDIENIRDLKGESTKEYLYLSELLSRSFIKVLEPKISNAKLEHLVQTVVNDVKDQLHHQLPAGTVQKHESEIISLIESANGFAEVFPEDKYFIVEELQKANHIVGMTGDGVNDAPALKKADCGIAVSNATDAARAAADIVLTVPGLSVIVDAIKQARITFERMKSYTIFRIAETIRIILFMTLAIVAFQFYPVTALMIIVLALLNDIPILAIAYDNTKIQKKPIRWDMKELLVLSSWLGIAGVLSSFLLFWYTVTVLKLPLELVQSIFFAKLVVAGHGTIYNTRTDTWFFKKPYPSLTLFGATFLSRIVGTIIAVYGFGLMEPIGWEWALGMWAYAMAWFVFNDMVKLSVLDFYRKKTFHSSHT
ncbi:plasma-membrane proton-efflux P-type ATPase [Sulfurimonas marina]|uniref:HAD-IC family P-type ATPase n=1 Tax=Sulfurimonas marina TaxID=2590551 RepID=A0A7M1AX08_9BACT|nr:plasma-membrane proton-efflux P-type ATPase [Sulfurimonas marina]QOP40902.1 HAD-IC family P-type ATPase [Sulfurimonas marina]